LKSAGLQVLSPVGRNNIEARDYLTEKYGWYIQTAFDLKPDRYQLVLKLDSFQPDRNLPGQRTEVYTAGVNWFLSPASKFQANFEYHRQGAEPDHSVCLLHLQVGFNKWEEEREYEFL